MSAIFKRGKEEGRENAPRGPNASDNLGEDEDGADRERERAGTIDAVRPSPSSPAMPEARSTKFARIFREGIALRTAGQPIMTRLSPFYNWKVIIREDVGTVPSFTKIADIMVSSSAVQS